MLRFKPASISMRFLELLSYFLPYRTNHEGATQWQSESESQNQTQAKAQKIGRPLGQSADMAHKIWLRQASRLRQGL